MLARASMAAAGDQTTAWDSRLLCGCFDETTASWVNGLGQLVAVRLL